MLKVLFIPEYFPTKKSEIIGSQIKEQLEFINNDFDIKVIYCTPGLGVLKFILNKVLNFFFIKTNWNCNSEELRPGILNAAGVKYFQPFFLNERIRFQLKYSAYEYVMMEIVESGWHPDIIHCRTIVEAGFIAERLSKKFDIPYKITENTFLLINEQTTDFILRNYLSCVKNCEGLSVVSNKVADFFISSNLYKKPYILPNSIDEKEFSLKNNTFSQKQIMFVGYNSYIKDIPTFSKALHHLKYDLEYNDFRVCFCLTQIFEETDIADIRDIFKANKIDSHLDIIPQVSRNKIAIYYQQSNVFVSTSVAETFGIASLEAMFCGTPVVAVDNGGIRDFISPKNGILIDKYDYKSIAISLKKILIGEILFNPKEVRSSVINKYSKVNLRQSFSDFYFHK